MKRLILITCSFLVVFAGVAAAWESCKQTSITSDDHHRSLPVHGHDHHSRSDDHHSSDSAIHCPLIGDYLATANFTVNPENRIEPLRSILIGESDSQFAQPGSYRLIHGPPGSGHSHIIPPYLLLSVLRI
jgi:hypothetical protein